MTCSGLYAVLGVDVAIFRTAWFVESIVTQILVIFVIRSAKPIWMSRPHPMLVATSLGALTAALILALTPIGHVFGFVPLPPLVLTAIALIAVGYLAMAEGLKSVAMPSRGGAHQRASAPIITGR
jgi:P-type Mg2+ transporter